MALCLSRKTGQRIVIDENIVIEIAEVRGDRVRVAISAPDYISIRREELPAFREPTKREQQTVGSV